MKTDNVINERSKGEWKVNNGQSWKVKEWAAIANMEYNGGDTLVSILAPVNTGSVTHEQAEANAAFICKAVNNYDSLLSALKEVKKCTEYKDNSDHIKNICEAALKQAEEL